MRVVITGASSGIGEALARHYAGADTVLGLISRRIPAADLPGKVIHYPADVTDLADDRIGALLEDVLILGKLLAEFAAQPLR